jgi:hypothetical protein
MKRILILICITVLLGDKQGFSQLQIANPTQYRPLLLSDINGIPYSNSLLKKDDIKGSPFLFDFWQPGQVKFVNGKKIDSLPLLFNMETNKLLFWYKQQIMQFADGVKEFTLSANDSHSEKTLFYRCRYPQTDGHNENSLYEVLAETPKLHLLQYTEKKALERRNYGEPVSITYEWGKSFYLYEVATQTMHKIKLRKSSITGALPAFENTINRLCSENNWELKTPEELKLLVSRL